jgi:signal transduction histidine kinase
LVRLGYRYLSLKNASWDEETNIFPDLFRAAIARINPDIDGEDIDRLLADVKLSLDNEDLGKAFYEKMWGTLLKGEPWTGVLVNRRKDGTLYQEETVISPIRDADGRLVNFVAIKLDVTREKELEAQLRQSQKMEAVGRLAGGVAHDFNNMLTVITGYSEFLLKRLSASDPIRSELEAIRQAGERAAGLTRQLLAFSRKQILAPQVLNVNRVVSETDKMLRRLSGRTWAHDGPRFCRTSKADPEQIGRWS